MTIEARLVEKSRDVNGHVHKIIRKKKFKKRANRPPQVAAAAVVPVVLQRLFESCRDVFRGPGTVPSPGDVQKLCRILDGMKPEDVGLSRDLQFFKPKNHAKGNPRVTYTTIYKCKNFSLCLFFLPATAVIPLHNHPGMTVFSKLLWGTMHIKSYDLSDPVNSVNTGLPSQPRLARMKANDVFTAPCDTSVLYPTSGGNIHAFTAITPCAVLDVLGPPYSKEDGRDCSYYKDTPYTASSNGETTVTKEEGESYSWLEEIEMPRDSQMDVIEYLGPQVMETSS
ncbi:Plant cysteine oxidase [Actinidia chinensis var. chinensis]|uniref:cysteine dioxygenase n=1 Tax=Actinidia chinensis var. chinensis TaxID=1590841 RepID=A0A2R6Q475_ACTCC|nr:Plant cysteine oxidase [Actinidia chinensis var. chinensis]